MDKELFKELKQVFQSFTQLFRKNYDDEKGPVFVKEWDEISARWDQIIVSSQFLRIGEAEELFKEARRGFYALINTTDLSPKLLERVKWEEARANFYCICCSMDGSIYGMPNLAKRLDHFCAEKEKMYFSQNENEGKPEMLASSAYCKAAIVLSLIKDKTFVVERAFSLISPFFQKYPEYQYYYAQSVGGLALFHWIEDYDFKKNDEDEDEDDLNKENEKYESSINEFATFVLHKAMFYFHNGTNNKDQITDEKWMHRDPMLIISYAMVTLLWARSQKDLDSVTSVITLLQKSQAFFSSTFFNGDPKSTNNNNNNKIIGFWFAHYQHVAFICAAYMSYLEHKDARHFQKEAIDTLQLLSVPCSLDKEQQKQDEKEHTLKSASEEFDIDRHGYDELLMGGSSAYIHSLYKSFAVGSFVC